MSSLPALKGQVSRQRMVLLLVACCCLIALLVTLLWVELGPDPAAEACDSCDIRHQRLKPKDPAAQ